jgi:aminoglycoside 2''-phosphotransferase
VFRFPNDEGYAGLLQNEVAILRRLEPLVSIRIPDYQYVPEDVSFAGYPLVPGTPLEKKYFDSLPVGTRTEIAKQLADFLTVLHTTIQNGHDFSLLPEPYMADDQADVKRQAEEYLPGILPPDEMNMVRQILARVDDVLARKLPSVFIHGDIYNRHLLWDDPARKLGVIDFSDMNRGDPAIDFSELHEYGREFVQEVYEYYGGPKDDTFLERAWVYQQWAAAYMLTDHFINDKTTWEEARYTFNWVKQQLA